MDEAKFFAARSDDPKQTEKYLIKASVIHSLPTTDGKTAIVVQTPEQFASFNAHRCGRRGEDVLRDTPEEALDDANALYRVQ